PAERGPRVDVDEQARRRVASREHLVDELREVLPEGAAVAPHVDLPGQALDDVDRRVAPLRVGVVARWQVDPERPNVRIAERVVLEDLALELELVEPAGQVVRPRTRSEGRRGGKPR